MSDRTSEVIGKLNDIEARLDYIIKKIDLLLEIEFIREQNKMDKEIKGVKKSLDKKMDKLVKDDIKRDKKCDYNSKMAKKAKKK